MTLHSGRLLIAALSSCFMLAACGGVGIGPVAPDAEHSGNQSNVFDSRWQMAAAKYHGCAVFPGSYYSNSIASARIDAESPAMIASAIRAGNTGAFAAAVGTKTPNLADDQTPLVQVHPKVKYHQFPVKYPWKRGFFIERISDHHAIVVQTQKCHVFESYLTTYNGDLWAYSGANWDLSQPFAPLSPGTPSSMASGLSLFAGLARWEDYTAGAINHALDWDAPQGTVAQYEFVRPASDTDGLPYRGSSKIQIPYGARLRLKSSVDTSGWGPESKMVANALKTYGMYLADTDTSGNMLYFANESDGSDPWNTSDLLALQKLHLSDFEVVSLPAIQRTPGH